MIAPTHNREFLQERCLRSGTRQLLWLTVALSCLFIANADKSLDDYLADVEVADFTKAVDVMQTDGVVSFKKGSGSDRLFKQCAESPDAVAIMEEELQALKTRSRYQKTWKSLSDAEAEKIAKLEQFKKSLGTKLSPSSTTDETLALMLYTENKMSLFGKLNWHCRTATYKEAGSDKETEFRKLAPYLKLAIKALDKLPKCGKDVLFRGLGIPKECVNFGETAMQFTSTSSELKGCYMEYGANANTLMIYLGFGSSAKDISAISLYPSESECLISPLQETEHDEERDIDLSDINTGDYVEIDAICFVTAPRFRWTEHNKRVWNSLRNAARSGRSLAKAVQMFQICIMLRAGRLQRLSGCTFTGEPKAAHGRTFEQMRLLREWQAKDEQLKAATSYPPSDTNSTTSEMSIRI